MNLKLHTINDADILSFQLFNRQKGIRHFISTRKGGVSSGKYASLNLSENVGDNLEQVLENRKRIAIYLGIEVENLLIPDQCHTNNVKVLTDRWNDIDLGNTDALITNQPGICLCILAADCVPVLLYDPVQQVVASVHAGWRGTAGRIISRTAEQMIKQFGTKPGDILAGIGPAISQANFETGDEVAEQFHFLFSDHPEILWKNPETGKIHIDLQAANHILLQRAGLHEENIETIQICTFANPDLFFSARRDGIKCGRFGTGIMLK